MPLLGDAIESLQLRHVWLRRYWGVVARGFHCATQQPTVGGNVPDLTAMTDVYGLPKLRFGNHTTYVAAAGREDSVFSTSTNRDSTITNQLTVARIKYRASRGGWLMAALARGAAALLGSAARCQARAMNELRS